MYGREYIFLRIFFVGSKYYNIIHKLILRRMEKKKKFTLYLYTHIHTHVHTQTATFHTRHVLLLLLSYDTNDLLYKFICTKVVKYTKSFTISFLQLFVVFNTALLYLYIYVI